MITPELNFVIVINGFNSYFKLTLQRKYTYNLKYRNFLFLKMYSCQMDKMINLLCIMQKLNFPSIGPHKHIILLNEFFKFHCYSSCLALVLSPVDPGVVVSEVFVVLKHSLHVQKLVKKYFRIKDKNTNLKEPTNITSQNSEKKLLIFINPFFIWMFTMIAFPW